MLTPTIGLQPVKEFKKRHKWKKEGNILTKKLRDFWRKGTHIYSETY